MHEARAREKRVAGEACARTTLPQDEALGREVGQFQTAPLQPVPIGGNQDQWIGQERLLFEIEADFLALPAEQQQHELDRRLAARIEHDFTGATPLRPRDLQPLPLLGIPGLTPDNADPAYYDDTWQFRPGRRQAVAA